MQKNTKLPYGLSRFERLPTEGFQYIDKTSYIELLESYGEQYVIFLRPRRFGKSLFTSMLGYYYGSEHKDEFQTLFGNYYIGKNPTPLANQYAVLQLQFSGIDTTQPEETYKGFWGNVRTGIQSFINRYGLISKESEKYILSLDAPNAMLQALLVNYAAFDLKIYVIIDEYDHFANELLAFDFERFKNTVSKNGFVRKFYELLKEGTKSFGVDRIFITGVTPITLDSLTSGFNIGENFSTELQLHEMMGFTRQEVKTLLLQTVSENEEEVETLLQDLKKWYNGYRFHQKAKESLYNPNMVLYFAKYYQKYKAYPEKMLDTNVATDYGKLRNLFSLESSERNYEVLTQLIEDKVTLGQLTYEYSFEKEFERNDFISLLYYMGLLTIQDSWAGLVNFAIPNYVIEKLYLQFFISLKKEREQIPLKSDEIEMAMLQMSRYNNPEPFFDIIRNILQHLADRDYQNFDEKYIKALILSTALLTNVYFVSSEQPNQEGYTDIRFDQQPNFKVNSQYVFELKYLKKGTAKKRASTQEQAKNQLLNYLRDKRLGQVPNLRAYTVVVVKSEVFLEKVFG